MEKIYIFGHKKPDTDSVTSAIALSYLKNKLGYNTEAYMIGNLNNESKYVLNYFDAPEPKYLNDVKLQIKDINYNKNFYVNESASIFESFINMTNDGISGLPIVTNNKKFVSMVTLKDISKEIINSNSEKLQTSYDNIINTIDGEEILKFHNEVTGNIIMPTYRSTYFTQNIKLDSNSIVIVEDRYNIIDFAIKNKVKLIIKAGDGFIKDEHLQLAKENKVSIISTANDAFKVSKNIILSNYITEIVGNRDVIKLDENDFVNDFIEKANKFKHTNYPIVNKNGVCKGLLRINDISDYTRKKVILVDHNTSEQSIDGIEDAEIIEIIDHHNIGNINTKTPINFRNMAVGSTNTILYLLYLENKVEIPKKIAGLMLSGIISDTLLLKSPTTTEVDKIALKALSEIAGVNYDTYGIEMLKEGSSIKGKTKEELLYADFKEFIVNNKRIGIGQILTMNHEEILSDMDKYVELIEDIANKSGYHMINFYITDIIKKGSYVLYNEKSKYILENSLNIEKIYQGYYMDGVISRKKQIIPYIMEELEK